MVTRAFINLVLIGILFTVIVTFLMDKIDVTLSEQQQNSFKAIRSLEVSFSNQEKGLSITSLHSYKNKDLLLYNENQSNMAIQELKTIIEDSPARSRFYFILILLSNELLEIESNIKSSLVKLQNESTKKIRLLNRLYRQQHLIEEGLHALQKIAEHRQFITLDAEKRSDILLVTMEIIQLIHEYKEAQHKNRQVESGAPDLFSKLKTLTTKHPGLANPQNTIYAQLMNEITTISKLIALQHKTKNAIKENHAYLTLKQVENLFENRQKILQIEASFSHFLVYIITLSLILYLGFILIRLRRSEKLLEKSSASLEDRVKERTKDLIGKSRELIKAKEKAEESTKLKGEFLANMSHEIRTL